MSLFLLEQSSGRTACFVSGVFVSCTVGLQHVDCVCVCVFEQRGPLCVCMCVREREIYAILNPIPWYETGAS